MFIICDWKKIIYLIISMDNKTNVPDILFRNHENDYGQLEYKYILTPLTSEQKDRLTSQVKFRVNTDDNYGQAIYDIGLSDDGFALGLTKEQLDKSLINFNEIVENAGLKVCDTTIHEVTHYAKSEEDLLSYIKDKRCLSKSQTDIDLDSAKNKRNETATKTEETIEFTRYVAEVIIRNIRKKQYIDLRIGVAGNVDAGKSTLLGVLTKGVLDNGRGSARMEVFNFQHEILSGRTSSIGQQIMGFDDKGNSVADVITIKKPTWEDIVKSSTKIITFFDLAGHASYLKTTIKGITSNRPDYCLIMVGSNIGSNAGAKMDMTVEHINLCLHMNVPFIIVLTKIDIAPPNVLKETLNYIKNIIKKKARKIAYSVKTKADLSICSEQLPGGKIVPIFKVSNVTGDNLDLLKSFLNYIPVRKSFLKAQKRSARMQIQDIYKVDGVGTVVGGMIVSGHIKVNDILKLGPSATGEFIDARIRSIQCKTVNVQEIYAATWITVSIPKVENKYVRKGMYLLSEEEAKTNWEFKAMVFIDSQNSINLRVGYQPHCHIGHITQTCKITDIVSINHSDQREKEIASDNKIMITRKTLDDLKELLKVYKNNPEMLASEEEKKNDATVVDSNKKIKYKKDPNIKKQSIIDKILVSSLLDTRIKDIMTREINSESLEQIRKYINKSVLPNIGPGDWAELTIRFCFRPEVIFNNEKKRFIFREGVTRGIGRITGVTDAVYEPLSNKKVTKGNKKKRLSRKRRGRKK
jgi:GTPase